MFQFGDGFDHYTTTSDPLAGYWDSGSTNFSLTTGRFAGSQGIRNSAATTYLTKSSGANDAVHHINCAFMSTAAMSGTNIGMYFYLQDNTTAQCSIAFRTDGVILLQSGAPGGTTLATYTTGVMASNVWYSFEFEVVIHPTAGRFRVRKNGNTADDFDSGAVLNTRPGTNSYANKLSIGLTTGGVTSHNMDDILWRSDASSVPFVGDIRCYTRMPASDASVQFARSPSPATLPTGTGGAGTVSSAANAGKFKTFVASFTGTIGTSLVYASAGATANVKVAIYDSTAVGGNPGNPLGTSNVLVNPVAGPNTVTWATPVSVVRGTTYWFAVDQDATVVWITSTINSGSTATITYASFPTTSPAMTAAQTTVQFQVNITPTINSEFVNEALQDGTTTYVYDSVVGHGDLYNLAPLGSTPSSIVLVTTVGFMEKSDAGARGAAMQLRSGANLIASTTWNPADKSAGTTLSNGNLTAALGGQNGVRGVFGQNANKYYFEITATAVGSATAIGLGNPSASLDFLGIGSSNAVVVLETGFVYMNNGGTSASIGAIANGAIICIAVDLTNQLIWFKNGVAGNWNGNAGFSPGGTGGVAFTAAVGGAGGTLLYPVVSSYSGGANFTANFGATAFAGTVPAGFSAGFGAQSGGTTVQSTPTLLSTSFTYLYRNDVLNPNGNVAWTAAAVDALTFGPVVTS